MIIPIVIIIGVGGLLGTVWCIKNRAGGAKGASKKKKKPSTKKKAKKSGGQHGGGGGLPPGGPPKFMAEEGLKMGGLEIEMTVNPLPKKFKITTSKSQGSKQGASPPPNAQPAEDSRAGKKGGLAGTDSLAHMDGRDSLALN